KDIGNSPPIWIKQQLLHPILFNMLILPTYNLGFGKYSIGKILIYVLQKLKFLSKPVYRKEIKGAKPKYFPQKMSGALAILANNQLKKLNSFNTKRKEIARYYFDSLDRKKVKFMRNFDDGAIWLRFPIQIEDSKLFYNS